MRSSSRTDRCRSTYSAAFDTAPPRFTHSAKNANHVGISRYTTVIAFGPYVKGKDRDKDQAFKVNDQAFEDKDKDKNQVSRTRIRTRTYSDKDRDLKLVLKESLRMRTRKDIMSQPPGRSIGLKRA